MTGPCEICDTVAELAPHSIYGDVHQLCPRCKLFSETWDEKDKNRDLGAEIKFIKTLIVKDPAHAEGYRRQIAKLEQELRERN